VSPGAPPRHDVAAMATSDDARPPFREGQRVKAAVERPGVPAGTTGRVMMITGFDWVRYRVRFDNGVELGSLDAKYLAPL
jgi:hypothetical protein